VKNKRYSLIYVFYIYLLIYLLHAEKDIVLFHFCTFLVNEEMCSHDLLDIH